MSRPRRPLGIRAVLPLGLLLAACGGGRGEAAAGDQGDPLSDPGAAERPQRIVPANSGAAELLLELVEPARLAAIPTTVEGYAHAGLAELELPSFQHYNAENVLSFEPDLVVTHAWQGSDATAFLESRGVPILILPDVGDFAGLLETVESLGERLRAPDRAAQLAGDLQARLDRLRGTDRGAIRLVSYTNFGSGGWTAGSGTTNALLCGLVGARNLAAEMGREGHTNVDFETLITWNPDVFLVGASGERPGHSPSADILRREVSLQAIGAVAAGRIVVLPAELYTTNSHRVMDAAERLAAELDALF